MGWIVPFDLLGAYNTERRGAPVVADSQLPLEHTYLGRYRCYPIPAHSFGVHMTTSQQNHRLKYGPEHRKRREFWKPMVALGGVNCAHVSCGSPIEPGTPWDLGHRYAEDGSPLESLPMHASCNRNTARSDRERDTGCVEIKYPGYESKPRNSRVWG